MLTCLSNLNLCTSENVPQVSLNTKQIVKIQAQKAFNFKKTISYKSIENFLSLHFCMPKAYPTATRLIPYSQLSAVWPTSKQSATDLLNTYPTELGYAHLVVETRPANHCVSLLQVYKHSVYTKGAHHLRHRLLSSTKNSIVLQFPRIPTQKKKKKPIRIGANQRTIKSAIGSATVGPPRTACAPSCTPGNWPELPARVVARPEAYRIKNYKE